MFACLQLVVWGPHAANRLCWRAAHRPGRCARAAKARPCGYRGRQLLGRSITCASLGLWHHPELAPDFGIVVLRCDRCSPSLCRRCDCSNPGSSCASNTACRYTNSSRHSRVGNPQHATAPRRAVRISSSSSSHSCCRGGSGGTRAATATTTNTTLINVNAMSDPATTNTTTTAAAAATTTDTTTIIPAPTNHYGDSADYASYDGCGCCGY